MWILFIIIGFVLVGIFTYSMYRSAKKADEDNERAFQEMIEKDGIKFKFTDDSDQGIIDLSSITEERRLEITKAIFKKLNVSFIEQEDENS